MEKLNLIEWSILDHLSDDDEPFESIDNEVKSIDDTLTPYDTLNIMLKLYKLGFVVFRDPSSGAAITTIQHSINDIIREFKKEFEEYCRVRKYLWNTYTDGRKSGIPFGIWISRIKEGTNEWGKECYKAYYKGV